MKAIKRTTVLCAALAMGCSASAPPPAAPITHGMDLCTGGLSSSCLDPARVEGWLEHPSLEVLDATETHRGIQGARVLTLAVEDRGERVVFRAKWRPQSSAKRNYSEPRVEVMAYQLQKLLVSSDRYILPPTVGRCFPVHAYRDRVEAAAVESAKGMGCVWGSLSYWLESALPLDEVDDDGWYAFDGPVDPRLFDENGYYRDAISLINLISYLTRNGDAHSEQFLMRDHPFAPHVYLVDSSNGFGARINKKLENTEWDWTKIMVPLPEDAVSKVLSWSARDFWSLRSVERYQKHGAQVAKQPTGPTLFAWAQEDGIRFLDGTLHIGLSDEEIDDLMMRVERLRDARARNELRTVVPHKSFQSVVSRQGATD